MENKNRDLLRFMTAWSVDNGKSTLIGRLLHDTKSIFQDQRSGIRKSGLNGAENQVNLAYLADGLKAEREQGITIDIAYKYFMTKKKKFIIADAPGHIEYTKNMITAASTVDVVVIIVDIRFWIVEQVSRHILIAWLLNVTHVIFCINKMDLVSWSEWSFKKLEKEISDQALRLWIGNFSCIPISALEWDNVVKSSKNMSWYEWATILDELESIDLDDQSAHLGCRIPIQCVIKPNTGDSNGCRGYAWQVTWGELAVGDEVMIFPSWYTSTIKTIRVGEDALEKVCEWISVVVTIEDDIDISRGDLIAQKTNKPAIKQDIEMTICRFDKKPLQVWARYIMKHTTKDVRCIVQSIQHKIDVNTGQKILNDDSILMNDIAQISVKTTYPLFIDSYKKSKVMGGAILIDERTNETVAACIIA